jgi:hypothetical protein
MWLLVLVSMLGLIDAHSTQTPVGFVPHSFTLEVVRPSYILEVIRTRGGSTTVYPEIIIGAVSGVFVGASLLPGLTPSEYRIGADSLYGIQCTLALLLSGAGAVLVGKQAYRIGKYFFDQQYRRKVTKILFAIKQDAQVQSYYAAIQNLVQVYTGHTDMLAHMLQSTTSQADIVLDILRRELSQVSGEWIP